MYTDTDDYIEDEEQEETQKLVVENNNKKNYKYIIILLLSAIVLGLIVYYLFNNKGIGKKADNYVINLYPEEIIVPFGGTKSISYDLRNNGELVQDAVLRFTIGNSEIAKIDNLSITGLSYGKTVLIATFVDNNGKTIEQMKDITVADGNKDTIINDVNIPTGYLQLPLNGEYDIPLTIEPTNGYVESKTFTSSNPSVAIVDNSGKVTAVSEGTAVILIDVNGKYQKQLKVYVSENTEKPEIVIMPTKITITNPITKLIEGESTTINYSLTPYNASSNGISFSSSDTSIIQIDNNRKITALKDGKATVTVSVNNISDSITINVEKKVIPVTDINLSVNEITMNSGGSQLIIPTVLPMDATDKTLTYTVDNPTIASIVPSSDTSSVTVTAIQPGAAVITIKSNSGEITKIINVMVTEDTTEDNPSSGSGGGGGSCGSCSKVTCTSGKYCNCGKCYTCQAGYACSDNKRSACPKGFYCPGNGVQTRCPSGKTTKGTGAKSADACTVDICPDGKYGTAPNCTVCPKGSYCYSGTKYDCPDGTTTAGTGATSSGHCQYTTATTCARGQYITTISGNKKCFSCPKGYWCDGKDQHKCPDNTSTAGTGAKYSSECTTAATKTCNAGYYLSGSSCLICPKGSVCFSNKKYACPNGTTTTGQGKSSYSDCK